MEVESEQKTTPSDPTCKHEGDHHCCIDPEALKEIEKYLCSACHCILTYKGSTLCQSCNKPYCAQCTGDFYEGDKCHHCDVEFKGKNIAPELEEELSKLNIICKYEWNGCREKPVFTDLAAHEKICEFKEITCVPCDKPLYHEHEFPFMDDKGEFTCEHCKWHKEHIDCEKKSFMNIFNGADFEKMKNLFTTINTKDQ
jgi:hypothetical protein